MDDLSGISINEIKKLLKSADVNDRKNLISLLKSDTRAGIQNLLKSHLCEISRIEAEENNHNELMRYERKLYCQNFNLIAGVDEAGRGALAGPLVAASAILPKDVDLKGLRDSKQLSPNQREDLYYRIIDKAIAYSVAQVEHHDIDTNGLQWANLRAMELAVLGLKPAPDYVLTDAFAIKSLAIPYLAIIKGDRLSLSIAAASVLAKVTRDRIMCDYHDAYPQYGFTQHKGYGTLMHKRALEKHGASPIHRKCFAPIAMYEQLRF